MLLTLFPMDNEEWVVSLFAVSIYRFKDYTMFYLNLVLNYVRFFHIFLWKLITLYIILLWSICVILWLSLMTELKIRQGYSWDMTLIEAFKYPICGTSFYTSKNILFMLLFQLECFGLHFSYSATVLSLRFWLRSLELLQAVAVDPQ